MHNMHPTIISIASYHNPKTNSNPLQPMIHSYPDIRIFIYMHYITSFDRLKLSRSITNSDKTEQQKATLNQQVPDLLSDFMKENLRVEATLS